MASQCVQASPGPWDSSSFKTSLEFYLFPKYCGKLKTGTVETMLPTTHIPPCHLVYFSGALSNSVKNPKKPQKIWHKIGILTDFNWLSDTFESHMVLALCKKATLK